MMFGFKLMLALLAALCCCEAHPPTTVLPARMMMNVQDEGGVAGGGSAYDSKFDNVDLDEILRQERLLNNYIKCLESLGPCTPDAKMLKDILPDAMMTDCVKCTEKQKYGAEKVTRHLIDNRPNDWQRLEKIYDPQGSYRLKYEELKSANDKKDTVVFEALDQAQGDS